MPRPVGALYFHRRRVRVSRHIEVGGLGLILLLYAVTAWAYATRTPDWQVPDEPAHYNYVRQIVETGELPVIEMGDWDQAYLDQLRACGFHPATTGALALSDLNSGDRQYLEGCGFDPALPRDLRAIQYEDHQPPLYYLLQSIVYRAFDGDLVSMRLFSTLLGSGVIICAWSAVRRLFPTQPWLGLSAAAFIAFLPQRLAIMAGVSNDSLAELIAALILLAVVNYLTATETSEGQTWLVVGMGILVGLAFLTKSTIYYVSGIAGLAILGRWRREQWPGQTAARRVALVAVPG